MPGCNLQVVLCPGRSLLAGRLLHAAYHGLDRVLAGTRSGSIREVRHLQLVGNLYAVAVEVVRHVIVLFAHDTPGTIDSTRCLNGYQPAVQDIRLALCIDAQRCYRQDSQ